jgi:hypothetical protein
MAEYRKIADGIYLEIVPVPEPTVIRMEELLNKRTELETLINSEEPTEAEVLEYGMQVHPYYSQKVIANNELQKINELINRLSEIE